MKLIKIDLGEMRIYYEYSQHCIDITDMSTWAECCVPTFKNMRLWSYNFESDTNVFVKELINSKIKRIQS